MTFEEDDQKEFRILFENDNDFTFNLNINAPFSFINEETNDTFSKILLTINSIELQTNPNFLFLVEKKKLRGKQKKAERNKIHLNTDLDNLLAKIQVHYISFIVNISNDALIAEFGEDTHYKFLNIDYKKKNHINYSSFNKYKNSTIKDILKLGISPKYKHYDKDTNQKIIEKVCSESDSDWFDKFLSMNYLTFFIEYYYDKKEINEIYFEGKIIRFSWKNKTRTFIDLLKKNDTLKTDLINTVNSVYLTQVNKNNKSKFLFIKGNKE